MRYLRACADACSIGAQTLRDQPDLTGVPDDMDGGLGETLRQFRVKHELRQFPLQVLYSESGRIDLSIPIFNTPKLTAIIATTEAGARFLRSRGSHRKGIRILRAGEERIDALGLVRVHERLFEEFGVRYLVCEGGAMILTSLYRAGILDEMFVTSTDVDVELSQHEGVKRIVALDTGAGRLIAEGRPAADSGYTFRRWRFNER
jgi:riboflavin biosynthesis pyrimidine reductase